ncbi:MAG: EI24 domain-containing protein [Bacteroidota bacterium]
MQSFLYGATTYFKGLQLIAKHRLWLYFWIPVFISLALAALVLNTAYQLSDEMGHWLVSFYPWEWGKAGVERIAGFMGGASLVVFTLLIFRYIVMGLASPFMSLLSDRLEQKLRPDHPPTPFSWSRMLSDLIRGLRIVFRNITLELTFTILLLLLGLIPIFSPFVPFLLILLQAYYAGFGNFDYTLERRFKVRQSVRFVRRNRMLAMGNGIVFVLVLMTGIGVVFALPLGTAAGVVVCLERQDAEQAN